MVYSSIFTIYNASKVHQNNYMREQYYFPSLSKLPRCIVIMDNDEANLQNI